MAKTAAAGQPVTRADLEARFAAVQEGLQGKVKRRAGSLKTAAIAGGVVMLLIVFLLGRRSGKHRSTFVEIRRL